MTRILRSLSAIAAVLLALGAIPQWAHAQKVTPFEKCITGDIPKSDPTKDLWVVGDCKVTAGTHKWANVFIIATGSGDTRTKGKLIFQDVVTDFWTSGIIVENDGSLLAGVDAPIGTAGGKLTIHLYGKNQGANGTAPKCVTDDRCGIPAEVWCPNGANPDKTCKAPNNPDNPTSKVALPGGVTEYFYQYGPLSYDGAEPNAFFGYKSIGVGYGGTIRMSGAKGAFTGTDTDPPTTGKSWVRLDGTLDAGKNRIKVDHDVTSTPAQPTDWQIGDEIVITTTDYLPGHSETFTITNIDATDHRTITLDHSALYRHQGVKYTVPGDDKARLKLANGGVVDVRGAVGLLTRSIRIVSEGDTANDLFPDETVKYTVPASGTNPTRQEGYYFGGHTIVRQGVLQYQVQGVEFKQLGTGGRIGHYPVHFHRVRQVPANTYVKDSSINESMTRWIAIHATSGVLIQRNVGWKSIGHGFYIEEGTETDNQFIANLGVFARGAIDNVQNPRKVPGILAAAYTNKTENVPFYSDIDHPSIFWIMNGWNDFKYNMAAGAGTCGVCYWLVPGANSGHSMHQKWEGYAAMQATNDPDQPLNRASTTPLKSFVGNSCVSAMNSFLTIGNTTACQGIGIGQTFVPAIPNPLAPPQCDQTNAFKPPPNQTQHVDDACILDKYEDSNDYYPKVSPGGGRFGTYCPADTDCSTVTRCSDGNLENCAVTVLDRYTSSFHWAETNLAAVWLRPYWYLFSNSALTDVQNGGLTVVTGGGYTASDIIPGHWALVRKTVFVGNSQDPNEAGASVYAKNLGPFGPAPGLKCAGNSGAYCLSVDEGVAFPISNFGMNQRMFNIYDGPVYQESNAYVDIKRAAIPDCTQAAEGTQDQICGKDKPPSAFLAGHVLGLPWDNAKKECYMPNAAIGWKQPNGFYYPPAFHSNNLYFANVDIRHYVIEPLFQTGTFKTDVKKARDAYCNFNDALFTGFTDIDRQTELTDDDGTLTGFIKTVSVNLDPFFNAPVQGIECESDNTAKTSPYDYVTTVVFAACASNGTCENAAKQNTWASACSNQFCFGVPLYRQFLNQGEALGDPILMAGQDTSQRSTLTVNHGTYFQDTQVKRETQVARGQPNVSVFQSGKTYYTFLIFAKPDTAQTYKMFVGKGVNAQDAVYAVRASIATKPPVFGDKGDVAWPSGWERSVDDNGILTVTMNMSFPEFSTQYNGAFEGKCAPQSFCKWNGSALPPAQSCSCKTDGLFAKECMDLSNNGKDVCAWAGADIDCPNGGCYGFAVQLPDNFEDQPKIATPAGSCVVQTASPKSPFDKPMTRPTPPLAGSCSTAALLPSGFCAPTPKAQPTPIKPVARPTAASAGQGAAPR